ncbi:DUF3180 domain-containing protein [Mycolicibacter longobardus]|uniref:DUF3180 domain-containing protein n=1 Tax=Mycolicibacter longobardus TaxID=1108812 RepID=A0A1X1YA05_9MYCO|nr:DUF3180 domain-containing protein [Mycolicibacter longobardus]MCV7385658.1 DUF3180 domain-containing protein [Mycolicibacter longobardus]ORW07918.1 hypothetical protein AWC16_20920 [Mycolicibacter longobardus]
MGPTRKRNVAAAAAVVAVISFLAVQLLYRWFPPITVWTGISLLAVAIAEAAWGRYVGAKIDEGHIGPGPGRLHPIAVARTVVVAKASAWMGALVLGFWLGVLGYLLQHRSTLQVAAEDTGGAVVAAVSALALLVAALWLQNCCKSPQDPGQTGQLTGNQPG